ncbi:hypothetical protein KY385_04345 [Candidatus Parcubacteria bacterium]|nr:hypothetical protein [Candidatus Parcubacteria bacterium]
MAKSGNKKQKANSGRISRLKSWAFRHKIWAGISFLIILYVFVWSTQAAVERYSYFRVEQKLENMLATLPNGKESNRKIETERRCGRGSAKFSAGPLRCSVEKRATYQLSEFKNPEQIYPEIYNHLNHQDFVKKDSIYIGLDLGGELNPSDVKNEMLEEIGADYQLKTLKDFNCPIVVAIEGENAVIYTFCSRDARMEFFKLYKP